MPESPASPDAPVVDAVAAAAQAVGGDGSWMDMIVRMVGCLGVVMVVSFLMTRFWIRREKRPSTGALALAGVMFGALSIYGTLGGYNYLGSFLNLRDMGPLIGGLFFGPVTGMIAAVMGAVHRLSMGAYAGTWLNELDSTIPCAIATLLAGAVGSVGRRVFCGAGDGARPPKMHEALGVALFMSVFHIGIVFAYGPAIAEKFFGRVWPIWIADYLVAMGSYVYAAKYLAHERAVELGARIMENELGIARDIQRQILPNIFPPFPDRPEIDLHAYLAPAREVGGDFYDFFMIDDRRLLLLVGDVSGKGVPAALFMAVTRTMLRSKDWRVLTVEEVISEVNTELSSENSEAMFVTLFGAAIDLDTGAVEYVNCGHNPPLLRRAEGAPGTRMQWVRDPVGLVLGVMPGFAFEGASTRMAPGDTLVIYTDGVTEAERADQAQYGEERLSVLLDAQAPAADAHETLDAIVADVSRFVQGAPPSDDLTLLCLRYLGPQTSTDAK